MPHTEEQRVFGCIPGGVFEPGLQGKNVDALHGEAEEEHKQQDPVGKPEIP